MQPLNPPPAQSLVNYTVIPTQASNEIYIAETDAPDSLAFLIKNNVIIKFSPTTDMENPTAQPKDDII